MVLPFLTANAVSGIAAVSTLEVSRRANGRCVINAAVIRHVNSTKN